MYIKVRKAIKSIQRMGGREKSYNPKVLKKGLRRKELITILKNN